MSGLLIYYLANTLMRGGIIVLSLLIVEFFLRRKLVFAGGRKIFIIALLLILLPLERIELPRGEKNTYTPTHCIEVPDWNVAWNQGNGAAAPVLQTPPAVPRVKEIEKLGWKWTLFDVLAIVYGVGVLFLSAKQIRHYFIWRNRIRRCIAITDGRVFDVFLESKRLTGLERFPVMLLDGGDMLPVAACFGTLRRGAVLCPLKEYDKYTDSELRMILIHELEHLRRNDNPVAFFLMMLSNFFFINPFVRVVSSRWAMITELDCDERVKTTLGLDRQGMAQYAGLLLASQTGGGAYMPGCGLGASARNLKLRIQESVMKRTKLQLLGYFFGICVLFMAGSFLIPELRADTREPINPLVAENLPADTYELIYLNGAALDRAGVEMLEKAVRFGTINQSLRGALYLMLASEKNKGHFYMASVPHYGKFVLVKNGADSDEMILPAGMSDQRVTARKMTDGYFALFPTGKKLPAMGLPERLKRKIATVPGEVLRSCKGGDMVSVVNRNDVYTLVIVQAKNADEKTLTLESIANYAVSYIPEEEREAKKAFINENVKLAEKTVEGKSIYEAEFPLSLETLTLLNNYLLKSRQEREKIDEPKVIALFPPNGATGVDPNLKEIKVTFDRPMNTKSWAFCQKSREDFPEESGEPFYDESRTVITMPVKLAPERTYNIYLNSPPYNGFRSAKGGVLQSVYYTFTTGK